jgi:hypothetical protein
MRENSLEEDRPVVGSWEVHLGSADCGRVTAYSERIGLVAIVERKVESYFRVADHSSRIGRTRGEAAADEPPDGHFHRTASGPSLPGEGCP